MWNNCSITIYFNDSIEIRLCVLSVIQMKLKKAKNTEICAVIRGVTIRYPHDAIRIAILESRYDTYRDTW